MARYSADGALDTSFDGDGVVWWRESEINTSEFDEYISGEFQGSIANTTINDITVDSDGLVTAVGHVTFDDSCNPDEEPPPPCSPLPASNVLEQEFWGMKFNASATGRSGEHFKYPAQDSPRYPFDVDITEVVDTPSGPMWVHQYRSAPTTEDILNWFDVGDEEGDGENVPYTDVNANELALRPDGSLIAGAQITGENFDNDGLFASYGQDRQLNESFGGDGLVEIGFGYGEFALENNKVLVSGGIGEDDSFALFSRLLASGDVDTSYGVNGTLPSSVQASIVGSRPTCSSVPRIARSRSKDRRIQGSPAFAPTTLSPPTLTSRMARRQ